MLVCGKAPELSRAAKGFGVNELSTATCGQRWISILELVIGKSAGNALPKVVDKDDRQNYAGGAA